MEIMAKAAGLLAATNVITLASVSEEGYPRICVMSKTKSEGIKKMWCSTGLSSVKVRHFTENPKASVCFFKDGDSVTLVGKVSVKTDQAIKTEMWLDWFIDHYPGGMEDPNYCILEFETQEATLWIDGEFLTVSVQ